MATAHKVVKVHYHEVNGFLHECLVSGDVFRKEFKRELADIFVDNKKRKMYMLTSGVGTTEFGLQGTLTPIRWYHHCVREKDIWQ